MVTPSPFSLAAQIVEQFASRLSPPPWVIHEVQNRIILLLNHVLQQDDEAVARLNRQQGKSMGVSWRELSFSVVVTPAGLLELADAFADPGAQASAITPKHDLCLTLIEGSPAALVYKLATGERPELRIEGDVQFAAEVGWLVDSVRWDAEEDLSRIVGDVAAHRMGEAARALAKGLQRFVQGVPRGSVP